jgi:hypothetical protein
VDPALSGDPSSPEPPVVPPPAPGDFLALRDPDSVAVSGAGVASPLDSAAASDPQVRFVPRAALSHLDVHFPDGATRAFSVDGAHPIEPFREFLARELGVLPAHVRLHRDGSPIPDGRPLAACVPEVWAEPVTRSPLSDDPLIVALMARLHAVEERCLVYERRLAHQQREIAFLRSKV